MHYQYLDYLSMQAANPRGFVGYIITRIWSSYFRDLSEWTFSLINLDNHSTILDVGFGGGANINYIKEHADECLVYGIDISEEAINTAIEINKKSVASGEVFLIIADVAYLPFQDELFDLVVATQSHIYWDELQKGLIECRRVLKKNGTLVITSEIDKIEYHLPKYKNPHDFVSLLYTARYDEVYTKMNNNHIAFICEK